MSTSSGQMTDPQFGLFLFERYIARMKMKYWNSSSCSSLIPSTSPPSMKELDSLYEAAGITLKDWFVSSDDTTTKYFELLNKHYNSCIDTWYESYEIHQRNVNEYVKSKYEFGVEAMYGDL